MVKWPNMVRWEEELHKSFPVTSWLEASQTVSKMSKSQGNHEINTSSLVPNAHQTSSYKTGDLQILLEELWRGGYTPTLWWSCPVSQIFWAQIADLILEVNHYSFDILPELAILDITLKEVPVPLRTVVQHILISARYVIAQNWDSPFPLPISEVLQCMNFHYQCETKLLTSPLQSAKLCSLWAPWVKSKYFVS